MGYGHIANLSDKFSKYGNTINAKTLKKAGAGPKTVKAWEKSGKQVDILERGLDTCNFQIRKPDGDGRIDFVSKFYEDNGKVVIVGEKFMNPDTGWHRTDFGATKAKFNEDPAFREELLSKMKNQKKVDEIRKRFDAII